MNHVPRARLLAAAGAALVLATAGCHSGGTSAAGGSPSPSTSITVTSCGHQLHLDHAPRKVVMLSDTDASVMARLGLLDRLVGRTGELRTVPYDQETVKKLQAVPTLSSTKLATGGDKVSTEAVLATGADLVVGYETGLDAQGLAKAGVPVHSPPAFCPQESSAPVGFDDVDREVRTVATLFDVPSKGEEVVKALHGELAAVPTATGKGTGAALFVQPGSTTFYAYGPPSMAQPVMGRAGLTNVYADQHKRVFDATMEDLIKRNPDWIVLLHGEGQADEVRKTFLGFNGLQGLDAVKHGHVVVLPFSLVDPPSPGSVKGAQQLAQEVGR